jgi:hypothetical protein
LQFGLFGPDRTVNHFAQFDRETALAEKLGARCEVFAGRTDPLIRADRIRALILGRNCADEVYETSVAGVQISYRLAFTLTYSQPLEQKARAA